MHSDWFSLGRDFAIWTISMETVISSVFFVFESQQIYSNCATKTTKIKHVNALIFAKLPKRWIFYRAYNKYEEDKYSRSEFYYPEDLETSNVKTESGIGESREAIDDFIKKQKGPSTNKKMATDLNTLLH